VSGALASIVAPGFFASGPVQLAAEIAAVVAAVCGAVGVFAVIRGQSFAGEALGDITTSGGSAAYLVGVAPLWAYVAFALAAAGAMELAGVQRARGRDLATGVVLGAGLGLAALFFYLDSVHTSASGATVTVMFGSIFTVTGTTVRLALGTGAATLAVLAALYRPLTLASLNAELASARGVPVRLVGALYLAVLAAAVALAAITIGTILSTALLIGPAATALRLTRSPGRAVLVAASIGLLALWLGIVLAYDSYYWPPLHRGWPVSFFVVTLIFTGYLLAGALGRVRAAH